MRKAKEFSEIVNSTKEQRDMLVKVQEVVSRWINRVSRETNILNNLPKLAHY
jgi:hypothetical protein